MDQASQKVSDGFSHFKTVSSVEPFKSGGEAAQRDARAYLSNGLYDRCTSAMEAMSCLAPPLLLAAIFIIIIIIIIIILRTGCLWQPPEALGQKFRNLAHSLGTVPWSSAQSFMSHT